jgi:hypothetical protein
MLFGVPQDILHWTGDWEILGLRSTRGGETRFNCHALVRGDLSRVQAYRFFGRFWGAPLRGVAYGDRRGVGTVFTAQRPK